MTDRRRPLTAFAAGVIPWVLIPYESGLSLVFSLGLVNPGTFHFQSVFAYLSATRGGVTSALLAWPTAALLYLLALASLALARIDREDRRVTAGLFALAGLDLLYFALSFSSLRVGVLAIPLGVPALWLAAWANRPRSVGQR